MKKTLNILLLTTFVLASITGCETTGDPNSGGIFWSEDKAKVRLAERDERLNRIESDTARVNRSNTRLESSAARRRRALGE